MKRATVERDRRIAPQGAELRAAAKGPGVLVGYASLYGVVYDVADFREVIMPGAFDEAMRGDVRGLVNHDPNLLIGRTASGTMRLSSDAKGLRYEIDLPDTSTGRNAAVSVGRGDISGSSFSFSDVTDSWSRDADGVDLRTITRIGELFDVGPVTFPASPTTTVQMRSIGGGTLERVAVIRPASDPLRAVRAARGRAELTDARLRLAAARQWAPEARTPRAAPRAAPNLPPIQLPPFARWAPPGFGLVEGIAHSWRTSTRRLGDGRREVIRCGAFRSCLETRDVLLKVAHEGPAIASRASGTLAVWETAAGLHFRAWVPAGVCADVRSGTLAGASVSMHVRGERDTRDDYGAIREVQMADLDEISLTGTPFHEGTGVWIG